MDNSPWHPGAYEDGTQGHDAQHLAQEICCSCARHHGSLLEVGVDSLASVGIPDSKGIIIIIRIIFIIIIIIIIIIITTALGICTVKMIYINRSKPSTSTNNLPMMEDGRCWTNIVNHEVDKFCRNTTLGMTHYLQEVGCPFKSGSFTKPKHGKLPIDFP